MCRLKNYVILIALLVANKIKAQSHYVVKWDMLQDQVSYSQIKFQAGKKIETKISEPFLKEGDILEAKIMNINEFIYKPIIKFNKRVLVEQRSGSFINNIIQGLGALNVGNGLLTAILKLNNISQDLNEIDLGNRGELSGTINDQRVLNLEKAIFAEIQSINYELGVFQKVQNEFNELNQLVLSEEIELADFKIRAIGHLEVLKKLKAENSAKNLIATISNLQKLIQTAEEQGIVNSLKLEIRQKSDDVIKICRELNVEMLAVKFSDAQFRSWETEIMTADFAYSSKYLIENLNEDGQQESALESTQFKIDFQVFRKDIRGLIMNSELNIGSDSIISYDALVVHKLVSVNASSPVKPVWITGLVYQFPLSKNSFIEPIDNNAGDSVGFYNGNSICGGLAIASNLMFEWRDIKKFIPNLSVGVSYKINEFTSQLGFGKMQSSTSNLSILLGGGIRTRGFRYFSINTGIAWSQVQVLNDNLKIGYFYEVKALENMGITAENYLINRWKPAIYLGCGFHF